MIRLALTLFVALPMLYSVAGFAVDRQLDPKREKLKTAIHKMTTHPFELELKRSETSDESTVRDLKADGNGVSIAIAPHKDHQIMEGFGAALTESSVYNILKLPRRQQNELLNILFNRTTGAGLNLIRVPMGASDLSVGEFGDYTYDDTANGAPDIELANFSMERDLKTLKLIRRILAINPDVKVMINPWTAPPWMKDNQEYYRGNFKSEYSQALADYFIRTIQEYHKYGIEVHYVGIQNEPGISVDYPSMLMSDDQQEEFIMRLGRRLRSEGFVARIIANDDNYIAASRVQKFIRNPKVAKHIGVAGFHCWSNDPEKALEIPRSVVIFETECGGNINSNNYGFDFYWWLGKRVIDSANYGLSAVIAWNMVSDENAGPHGAGPQSCKTCRGLVVVRPSVDTEGKTSYKLELNSELQALMHASKFVRRGAKRVESTLLDVQNNLAASKVLKPNVVPQETGGKLMHTAFVNPNGSIVLIVGNPGSSQQTFRVLVGGKFRHKQLLGAGDAITIVLKNKPL